MPERFLGMSFESPRPGPVEADAVGHLPAHHSAAAAGLLAVLVDEEPSEHVHVSQSAERLGCGAQFGVVVRRRSGCCQQPVLNPAHELGHRRLGSPVEALEDRRLIADHATERARVELVELFVVRHGDGRGHGAVAGDLGVVPELPGLGDDLLPDSQWRQQQHRLAGAQVNLLGPRETHRRLA